MIYLVVMALSACGILLLFVARGVLRSRNVRRIVRSVRKGFHSAKERNARFLPETIMERPRKSPRTCAVELQQVRTLLRKAEKSLAKQDMKSAERSLIQALTIQPDAKEVKAQLARLYLDSSREPKAEALYRELLQALQDPALYGNLGLACYKQGKFVEACHAYQEALNLDPKDPTRSYDLGRACIAAHKFSDAAHLLEKAAASLTRDTELLHLLAQCYLQVQDTPKAEEIYRRINRLEPGNEEVKKKITSLAQVS